MPILTKISIILVIVGHYALIAGEKPRFIYSFELAEIGFDAFDPSLSIAHKEKAFSKYLEHPLMELAFKRYSSKRRPPENRIDKEIFRGFILNLWRGFPEKLTHERLKAIEAQYRWGLSNFDKVKSDCLLVKSKLDAWLNVAVTKIPFGTPAVGAAKTPVHLVFLFDPGGSYPWVLDNEEGKYVYFDVLQLRGLSDKDRSQPIRERSFIGFLTHELFHQFQADKFTVRDKADHLVAEAVGEGSAMLIGNNAFGTDQEQLNPNEEPLMDGKMLNEWKEQMPKVRTRIDAFRVLHRKWKAKPPSEAAVFDEMSRNGWVATPANRLVTGDIYRVGAQMLLDIKHAYGLGKFYEVIGDSGRLLAVWNSIRK